MIMFSEGLAQQTNLWLFKIAVSILLFDAFLVSSIFPNGLFVGKELGLWFGAGTACILCVIKLFYSREVIFNIKIVDIVIFAFLILLPVCNFFSYNIINDRAIFTQIALGASYVSFRVLSTNLRSKILINASFEVMILALSIQLIIALAQTFEVIPSYYAKGIITGVFFNPSPFAIFVSSLTVTVLMLFLRRTHRNPSPNRIFYFLLFVIATYYIINASSRSAWLGGIVSLIITGFFFLGRNSKMQGNRFPNKRLVLGMTLVLLIPFLYWLFHFKTGSSVGRILIWKVSALMLKDHWIWGFGLGNFAPNYLNFQGEFFQHDLSRIETYGNFAGDIRYAFNDVIQIFCENGLIGILLFGSVLFLCCRMAYRILTHDQQSKANLLLCFCAGSSLSVIIISGFTSYPLAMLPISILFWFLISIIASIDCSRKIAVDLKKTLFKPISIGLILSLGISYLVYGVYRYKAYAQWSILKDQQIEIGTAAKLTLLYKVLGSNPEYLSDLASAYFAIGEYNYSIKYLKCAISLSPYPGYYYSLGESYEKVCNYKAAAIQYTKISKAIPNLLRPKYLLAMLYYHKMDYLSFKKFAREALGFGPKVNSFKVILMKAELQDLLNRLDQNRTPSKVEKGQ